MGLGTQDSAQALSYLKRFGSVTVLNGHIHQTLQKVEGNVTFHTAFSTAFPSRNRVRRLRGTDEGPGRAASEHVGPDKRELCSGQTLSSGYRLYSSRRPSARTSQVRIDNFAFAPADLIVAPGTTVTWVNHDDIPHTVVSTV